MNFLAHFHLAWPDEGLVAGGLEGDYYKGPLRGDLRPDIERGVVLHRAIDAYTDQHQAMVQLRGELPPRLRRFAGIVIDLAFDHYLSRHWQQYSDVPLADFSGRVYQVLQVNRGELSTDAQRMVERLLQHDILNLYSEWRTVTATAARIGERFGARNPFLDLERDLEPLRPLLEEAFLDFYPDLQTFAAERTSSL